MKSNLKVAIVSPYPPSKCTLNEYGYHLVNHFRQNNDTKEVILIADQLP